MSINLNKSNKKEANLNNERFFNYNNEIEKNVNFEINSAGILEVGLKDNSCTAKFGKHPDQTMNISTIKIVKGYVNTYEEAANDDDGEIILTYIPQNTSFSEYGQVCIRLKGLEDEDPQINKFFDDMMYDDVLNDSNKNSINLDLLLPNGSKFFYATTNDTVLDSMNKSSNVVLFDNYNIVYCSKKLLNLLSPQTGLDILTTNSLSVNHSGSVNVSEEFITECTPIGADGNTEDWAKPAKNTIFSFFSKPDANNIAWKKISAGEIFTAFGDYTDEEGKKGDDIIVYAVFHFLLVFFVFFVFILLVNLTIPVDKYYKEGVKVGRTESLGTDNK